MAEKEYIEREEIIKRIKLRIDDYSRDHNSFAPKMVLAYKEFLYMVEYLPTVDVQEVVRCKECIHICLHSSGDFYCSITGTEYKSYELDHYCSYGAKMDKE